MISFDNLIAIHEMLWPDINLQQQCAKFEEEEKELKEAEYNTEESLYELADMIIVSAGIARFDYVKGLEYFRRSLGRQTASDLSELWNAVEKKMLRNLRRDWQKKADVGYKHTKGIED